MYNVLQDDTKRYTQQISNKLVVLLTLIVTSTTGIAQPGGTVTVHEIQVRTYKFDSSILPVGMSCPNKLQILL